MNEPHYTQRTILRMPLVDVTNNLADNFHLRWSYGLLFLDQYTDEDDRPMSIIYGIRKAGDNEIFHIRVVLAATKSNSTEIEIQAWHVQTKGWPFVNDQGQSILAKNPEETHLPQFSKIANDVVQFSQTPHGGGQGVFDLIRRTFLENVSKRIYRRR